MQNCNRYKNIWIECGPGVVTISVSWSAWHGSGSDHFTQIKLYQNIRTRSDLNHICGISSVHTFGHSTVFVTFHYQSMGRIINLLFFSEHSRRRSSWISICSGLCNPAPSRPRGRDRRQTRRQGAPRPPRRQPRRSRRQSHRRALCWSSQNSPGSCRSFREWG